MNKAELVDAIAQESGLTKIDSKKALEAFISSVGKALSSKDGKVALVGFGTFAVSQRPAREGRNPKTGAVMKIASKNSIRFKVGKELSEKVNS